MSWYLTTPVTDRWVRVGWRHDNLWSQNDTAGAAIGAGYNYGILIYNCVITAYGSDVMLWKYSTSAPALVWPWFDVAPLSQNSEKKEASNFCLWQKLPNRDRLNRELARLLSETTVKRALHIASRLFPKMLRRSHASWTYKPRSVYLENQSLVQLSGGFVFSEPSPSHLFTAHIAFKCQTTLSVSANRSAGRSDSCRSLHGMSCLSSERCLHKNWSSAHVETSHRWMKKQIK